VPFIVYIRNYVPINARLKMGSEAAIS
jgi:hypothetical protein